jgi:hypothetical protein
MEWALVDLHGLPIRRAHRAIIDAMNTEEIRLLNDETGWTAIHTTTVSADDCAAVVVPVPDRGRFRQQHFLRSGERDPQGRPIYRTRRQ